MLQGLIYHNHQLEGDTLGTTGGRSDDVSAIVYHFYNRCMQYKRRTGLTQRLTWAYRYLTSDRPTHIRMSAYDHREDKDEDSYDEEYCDTNITVNLDFIGSQFNIALSVYQDALKFRGTDYVTISPTPIAETSDESKERIRNASFNSIVREVLAQSINAAQTPEEQNLIALQVIHDLMGTDDGLSQIDEFISRQRQVEISRMLAEANVKSRNAKSMVDDILAESNYDDVMMVMGNHGFWYDYAVVRAPFKSSKKKTKIQKSGLLKETVEDVWCMENVHPMNHFFAEDTTFNDMGSGEGDVAWLNRSAIAQLSNIDGGQPKAVDHVLDNFISYTYGYYDEGDHKDDNMEDWEYPDNIPVIRAIMRLDADTINKIFGSGSVEGRGSAIAEFWVAQDQCLYMKLEPRYLDYNPYRKNGYKIKDLSEITSSRGIYSLLRSAQELIDNAAVNVFDNLQKLPNYITEINRSKLKDPDDVEEELETDLPIIYTNRDGYRAEFGGNDRAINIIGIPNNIDVYLTAMREGISLMQQLGFSPFALGQQNLSNVRSTGLGAILQQNANKDFSRFLQAQEDMVESPIAEYIWTVEAIERRDPSIIVDGQVIIQSYTGFLQKDTEAENIGLFAQNIAALMGQRNALLQSGQTTEWFDSLITQYTEANGFDSGSLPFGPDVAGLVDAPSSGVSDVTQNIGVSLDARNNVPSDINQI